MKAPGCAYIKECLTSRQAEIEKKVDSQHPQVGPMQLRNSGPPQAHFLISGSSGSSPRAKHFASVSCCLSLLHGSTCFIIFDTKTLGKTVPGPNWGQIHYRYINQLYMYTGGVDPRLKSSKNWELTLRWGVPSRSSFDLEGQSNGSKVWKQVDISYQHNKSHSHNISIIVC